jgi:hypothetical protein
MRNLMILAAVALAFPRVAHANTDGQVVVVPESGDGRGVAVADDGTRYITGAVATQPDAGSDRQPFLIALDPQGQVRWRLTWEGIGQAAAVAATAAGPVVIVRFRARSFDADPGPDTVDVEAGDGRSAVAIALTPAGALRWTWSTPRASLTAVAALPDGSVAIAGTSLDFVGFVAAVDSLGGTTWHRALAKTETNPHAIAVSDAGIFVTGTGNAAARRAHGFPGAFVARLELGGDLVWLRRLGTRGSMIKGYAVAAGEHRVAIGGLFRGRPDFDPGPGRQVRKSVDADDDGFVAVFDTTGELDWVYTYGAASSDQVRGIALDAAQVYALGNQTEVVDLGGTAGVQDPKTKWFLLTLDGKGAPRASTPVVVGTALTYPGLYVGSMIFHRGRVLVMGEASRFLTVLGRPVAPAGFGADGRSPVMIDLAPGRHSDP